MRAIAGGLADSLHEAGESIEEAEWTEPER
jgi:hypothetical protein